jgi:hypothetical protein
MLLKKAFKNLGIQSDIKLKGSTWRQSSWKPYDGHLLETPSHGELRKVRG